MQVEQLTLEPTTTDKDILVNRIEFVPIDRVPGLIKRQNGSWKTVYRPDRGSGYQT